MKLLTSLLIILIFFSFFFDITVKDRDFSMWGNSFEEWEEYKQNYYSLGHNVNPTTIHLFLHWRKDKNLCGFDSDKELKRIFDNKYFITYQTKNCRKILFAL